MFLNIAPQSTHVNGFGFSIVIGCGFSGVLIRSFKLLMKIFGLTSDVAAVVVEGLAHVVTVVEGVTHVVAIEEGVAHVVAKVEGITHVVMVVEGIARLLTIVEGVTVAVVEGVTHVAVVIEALVSVVEIMVLATETESLLMGKLTDSSTSSRSMTSATVVGLSADLLPSNFFFR